MDTQHNHDLIDLLDIGEPSQIHADERTCSHCVRYEQCWVEWTEDILPSLFQLRSG